MRKRLRPSEPISYWKSAVDVITTLLMVILLVLMFFVLNFLINDGNYDDQYENSGGHAYNDYNAYGDSNGDEGDDNLSPTPTPSETPTPTPTPTPQVGGGGGIDDPGTYEEPPFEGIGRDRCAVYAVMVDEETGMVIEEENVLFELYAMPSTKQILSTHYPVPISYTEFATTDGGWFYLPEKIRYDKYFFHQISEVEGYDFTSDVVFEVNESLEWDKPLVVRIPFGASKNNIQVQIDDISTEIGIPGVMFEVIADGDVITPDGTIRYKDGDVVDIITCNSTGYGLSTELYLGKYILEPKNLPSGYAAPDLASRQIELPRRSGVDEYAPIMNLESGPTTIAVRVSDEIDINMPIEGMKYKLTCDVDTNDVRELVTDDKGVITITELRKNATYTLEEEELVEGYISQGKSFTFDVDELGLISGEQVYSLDLSYRMIRTEISIKERVLGNPLMGFVATLKDADGNVVASWTTNGEPHSLNGIEPGSYMLEVEDVRGHKNINIQDTQELQNFDNSVMTRKSYMILAGVGLLILIAIAIMVIIVVPKIKDKNTKKSINGKKKKKLFAKKDKG